MVKAVSSYCNGTNENVKSRNGIKSTTSGPQGAIAAKTVVSLSLLENSLERLNKNIGVLSPTFSIMPEICLTSSGGKCARCQPLQAPVLCWNTPGALATA